MNISVDRRTTGMYHFKVESVIEYRPSVTDRHFGDTGKTSTLHIIPSSPPQIQAFCRKDT